MAQQAKAPLPIGHDGPATQRVARYRSQCLRYGGSGLRRLGQLRMCADDSGGPQQQR